jgi:hypothetical protein
MNKLLRAAVALMAALGLHFAVLAQDAGTKDEARAMAQAAAAHVAKVGPDKAWGDFVNDRAAWIKKDLYVFAFDLEGNIKSHGANPKLAGKNLIGLKDQSGKEFVKDFIAVASGKGEGWVDYDWAHPQTKKVEGKTSYIKRIAGTNLGVAVGVYR